MSKDLNRVAYTRRMMEIMANIQKQKEDIGKILADTRIVQKEINGLTGKLDRVFTVTDEQVYKDARKDEARRTAYKLLASLREVCTTVCVGVTHDGCVASITFCILMQNCDMVVEAIKETGQTKRGQKDLEEQVSEPQAVTRVRKNKFLTSITTKTHTSLSYWMDMYTTSALCYTMYVQLRFLRPELKQVKTYVVM